MTRKIEDIEADLAKAKVALDEADEAHDALKRELAVAKIAAADHPWIGKKVKRQVRHGYRHGQTQTIRGTVRVYGSDEAKGYFRGLYGYRQNSGDLIVVSKSGKTAHEFRLNPNRFHANETDWELEQ